MKKRKPLPTQEFLNRIFSYDAETGILRYQARDEVFALEAGWSSAILADWNSRYAGTIANTKIGAGYICVSIQGVNFPAHRVIWKMVHGVEPDTIDHIDGDKSNNRVGNLRDVTESENQKNRKLNANNSSGFPGVHWCSTTEKWVAKIGDKGRTRVIGKFIEKSQAIAARKMAEAEFGFHPNHGRIPASSNKSPPAHQLGETKRDDGNVRNGRALLHHG